MRCVECCDSPASPPCSKRVKGAAADAHLPESGAEGVGERGIGGVPEQRRDIGTPAQAVVTGQQCASPVLYVVAERTGAVTCRELQQGGGARPLLTTVGRRAWTATSRSSSFCAQQVAEVGPAGGEEMRVRSALGRPQSHRMHGILGEILPLRRVACTTRGGLGLQSSSGRPVAVGRRHGRIKQSAVWRPPLGPSVVQSSIRGLAPPARSDRALAAVATSRTRGLAV